MQTHPSVLYVEKENKEEGKLAIELLNKRGVFYQIIELDDKTVKELTNSLPQLLDVHGFFPGLDNIEWCTKTFYKNYD